MSLPPPHPLAPPHFRRIDFDEIDSTSLHARRLVERGEAGEEPLVIVAAVQTGGIGRMGKPWCSPRGGLWFTLVWKPVRRMPALVEGLGLRIGVAVVEGLRAAAGSEHADRLKLKWPNDVLADRRKVCGVLTETAGSGGGLRVLVGVGVNANVDSAALPESLREQSTTLRDLCGREIDLEGMLRELVGRIGAAVDGAWPDSELIRRANAMLHGIGSERVGVLEDGTADYGVLLGLDGQGAPVVRTSRGMGRLPTTAI
jgi:BirA family biotin operon repressor/biotin-[acetyl-CoA-carboxylase] ligase